MAASYRNDEMNQSDTGPHTVTNSKSVDRAFKKFAIRHGLKMSEVGKHESRTMDYKTDFPGKKKKKELARKLYGDPAKLKRWARKHLGQ
tara:strand:+ start:48 stop:314 length:267 start_codon:yes stop_codon:yes gene_type:complete